MAWSAKDRGSRHGLAAEVWNGPVSRWRRKARSRIRRTGSAEQCGRYPSTPHLEAVVRRDRLVVVTALLALIAPSWAYRLAGAGVYQLTPIKHACLSQSPGVGACAARRAYAGCRTAPCCTSACWIRSAISRWQRLRQTSIGNRQVRPWRPDLCETAATKPGRFGLSQWPGCDRSWMVGVGCPGRGE